MAAQAAEQIVGILKGGQAAAPAQPGNMAGLSRALRSDRRRAGLTAATSQNKLSCSFAGFGARKCAVESENLLAFKPSFSHAISKRRPIIQA